MNDQDVKGLLRAALLKYRARHTAECPEAQQAYWRMREEYRPPEYGPDKPCTCGLDRLLEDTGE